jgi:hypothetical protein
MSGPQSQLDELGSIRGLITDATKDTALWLQADPTAEERVHVLAIQERLADLARIVERRMERRKLPKDKWEYSETVSEVLSRLDKARKLRGNIVVGKGLGLLTECLPQQLPGSKVHPVTQAPGPPPDWHEELKRARNMEDDFGFLTFGHAWDAVRILAQTNDPIDQEKRINSLWRMYPKAAEQLGLPKLLASSKKKPKVPRPVELVNTWRGSWLGSHESKPTQVPHDPPIYFPSDLWPQTNVILLKAQRKFPLQTQTLELWKHVTSQMTPLFCEAVKAGKIEAGAVLRERLGGMEDLLHSLLVHNDDGPKGGFSSLSDQAYRLGQKVRQSDEWLALAKAIADAQAASSHPQNSDETAQIEQSKSMKAAARNTREELLRPILEEKGFSVHDWAKAAKVDFHTADNYLKRKTKPHPNTLKKLADALGIEVAKMPR